MRASPAAACLVSKRACERALVRAARAQGAGSRQQVRAAARRFVRRHRRDAGYLAWVLRSVTVSSALAVALLGLGAAPAHAALAPYSALTGAANPLSGQGVGGSSKPWFVDLDADGDLDVVAGEYDGVINYFENTGSATSPALVPRVGPVVNPFHGIDVGQRSSPAFGDLDADGDVDLLIGKANGTTFYFENTESAASPAFVERTGAQNPMSGNDVGDDATPALGDLDGDGDLDLVVGESGGTLRYYRNTGTAITAAFAHITGAGNPWNAQDLGSSSNPALGDLDDDGDLDLIAGELAGGFATFENTGTATSPAFIARTGAANPLTGIAVAQRGAPALGDYDSDGDLDLVAGEDSGSFSAARHLGGRLVPRTGSLNPLGGASAGFDSAPSFGDLDNDGDRDLVVGKSDGTLAYFRNTGTKTSPAFAAQTGAANPLSGQDVGDDATPALRDLDADGDLDLVAGALDGTFRYFRNTGSATNPAFAVMTGAANPLDGQSVGSGSAPSFADLDHDGDPDLVAGESAGTLLYYENTGSLVSPAFASRTGTQNPLDGEDVGTQSTPSLGDVDGDGDSDLFVGEVLGSFAYYENAGSVTIPSFVLRTGQGNPLDGQTASTTAPAPALVDFDRDLDLDLVSGNANGTFDVFESFVPQVLPASELTGSANPLAGQDVGVLAAPTLGDLDGDGDVDLVAGDLDGAFHYYRNTGSATAPAFIEQTGAGNPLDALSLSTYSSAPALGDLDADGDLDLIVGDSDGLFHYFENTGTAVAPAFLDQTGATNPLDGEAVAAFYSAPSLGDLDGDGDLDLVAGTSTGGFHYFENTGTATGPAFAEQTGTANPLDGYDIGFYATPALGDYDRDGDVDLVAGENGGVFAYFSNTGTATAPAFVRLTGVANPLHAENVGAGAAPAAADINGEGRLDLITGTTAGTFHLHYFPEPARGVLLAAGIALLSLFERLRTRKRR